MNLVSEEFDQARGTPKSTILDSMRLALTYNLNSNPIEP